MASLPAAIGSEPLLGSMKLDPVSARCSMGMTSYRQIHPPVPPPPVSGMTFGRLATSVTDEAGLYGEMCLHTSEYTHI